MTDALSLANHARCRAHDVMRVNLTSDRHAVLNETLA
jgi:hypothetical protein